MRNASPLAYLKNHTSKTSRNFLYMLPVVVAARSASDDSANTLCSPLPVLWMTSSFHIQITSHNSNGVWLWKRIVRNDRTGAKSAVFYCLVPSAIFVSLEASMYTNFSCAVLGN